ncbi:hypothetical protein BPAE_0036g00530 [Botrytis paeoniae]|uniref:Uncharacterized protein n=1 Tax=Botrytis paeoniae TaxID=278948 RepID=A0A4Z1FXT0_9HELO|nr:hypothetical protein BPAE_0036g00530 [Botrytis paeoniae]
MPDKIPTLQVLATRRIYNLVVAPHILTFINQAMDYLYMKDLLLDYMIGVILYVVSTGTLFMRVGFPHTGRSFLDPDGLPLIFHGFLFVGAVGLGLNNDQLSLIPQSPYTFYNLDTYPNYAAWVSTHLWNEGSPNTLSAYISMNNGRKDDRHKSLNLLLYTSGPLSVPQPSGYAAHFPYKRPPGVKFVSVHELQMAARGPLLLIGGLPPPLPPPFPPPLPPPPPPPAPVVIGFSSSSSSYSSSYSSSPSLSDSSPDEGDGNGGGGSGGEDEPVVVISSGGEEPEADEVVSEEEVPEEEVVLEEADSHEGKLLEIVDSPAQGQGLKRGRYRYHKGPAKRRAYRVDI